MNEDNERKLAEYRNRYIELSKESENVIIPVLEKMIRELGFVRHEIYSVIHMYAELALLNVEIERSNIDLQKKELE